MQNQMKMSKNIKSKTPMLDSFSRDVTKIALENKLDPIIGRDKEIERVSQILTRRKRIILFLLESLELVRQQL